MLSTNLTLTTTTLSTNLTLTGDMKQIMQYLHTSIDAEYFTNQEINSLSCGITYKFESNNTNQNIFDRANNFFVMEMIKYTFVWINRETDHLKLMLIISLCNEFLFYNTVKYIFFDIFFESTCLFNPI